MYFGDGPLNYIPNLNATSDDDFLTSPSGLPSVNVGSYQIDAKGIIKSLKSLHGQLNFYMAKMMGSCMHEGPLEEPVVKSAAEAIKFRETGNEEFRKNNLDEAVKLYTQSIANAFEGTKEQMLAYANRSAALLRLGELESCLHDINRSLNSSTYPQSLREKLEKRKVSCLATIRTEGIQGVEDNATDPVNMRENDDDAEWQALCRFDNPLIPNASAKIKIMCDDVWGRHLVATKDIEPGEILSVQKFNSLVLHEDRQKEFMYCSYCLSKCLALIPCPTCIETMFCSTYCRTRAYETYHRVECKIMYKANRAYKFRSMRLLIEGTEQGARIPELMAQMTAQDVLVEKTDPSNQPFVNDYKAVLRMSRTFNPEMLSNFYTFANDFISGLRDCGLCSSSPPRSLLMQQKLSKTEIFVAMLLMNHATTARSHSFAISPIKRYQCLCENIVGIGFCALHSFVNHSCDPNVSFFTRNRQHVLVATRPIKKGEQLFHSYWSGYHRTLQGQQQRVDFLSMFFGFTCRCEACTKNWPTIEQLRRRRISIRAGNVNNAKRELLHLLNPLTGGRIMDLGNEDIIRCMSQLCTWAYANTKIPSRLLSECEAGLFQFMVLTYDTVSNKFTPEEIREDVESFFKSVRRVVRAL